jgi:hypothetical protein
MPLNIVIAKNSKFQIEVIHVRPNYPKFDKDLIMKTCVKYLTYFAKYLPDISPEDLEAHILSSSWPAYTNTPVTRNEARGRAELHVICDECSFNMCKHLFPEVMDIDLMRETLGDVLGGDNAPEAGVTLVQADNPHMSEELMYLVRVGGDVETIRELITADLKAHHAVAVRAGLNSSSKISNVELDKWIESIKPHWRILQRGDIKN